MYNRVIWQFYTLHNAHHDMCSYQSPYHHYYNTTIFFMLYFSSLLTYLISSSLSLFPTFPSHGDFNIYIVHHSLPYYTRGLVHTKFSLLILSIYPHLQAQSQLTTLLPTSEETESEENFHNSHQYSTIPSLLFYYKWTEYASQCRANTLPSDLLKIIAPEILLLLISKSFPHCCIFTISK